MVQLADSQYDFRVAEEQNGNFRPLLSAGTHRENHRRLQKFTGEPFHARGEFLVRAQKYAEGKLTFAPVHAGQITVVFDDGVLLIDEISGIDGRSQKGYLEFSGRWARALK